MKSMGLVSFLKYFSRFVPLTTLSIWMFMMVPGSRG